MTILQILVIALGAIGLLCLLGALFLVAIGCAAAAGAPRREEEPEFDTVNFDSSTGARKREFEEPDADAVFAPSKPCADQYSDLPPAWLPLVAGGADAGRASGCNGHDILTDSGPKAVCGEF